MVEPSAFLSKSLSSAAQAELKAFEHDLAPDTLMHYGQDWTRFERPDPTVVVWPKDRDEVVALVNWARRHQVALVPSGGRTGLSGGAVAAAGEVVVSMDKLRRVLAFDPATPAVRVQAGVTIGAVQAAATEQGLYYPVDWAAAGSSQVGGSIATNAGGIRVLRYGMTREWVLGLEVVTGRGDVLQLNRGLLKNNAGLDLRHLMIGSEGVLGLITEATFRLTQPPAEQSVLLMALTKLEGLMPVLQLLRQALSLSAFEFFDRASVAQVASTTGQALPIDDTAPFYVLAEFDNPEQSNEDKALQVFEQLIDAGWVGDGTLSQSASQAQSLWRWREAISESIAHRTPYKNDLSVPIAGLPTFLAELAALVTEAYPQFEVLWYGHLGDGNLHMNVLRPEELEGAAFHAQCNALTPEVFALVQKHGGSVSAEHGVGLLKRDYLHYTRSAEEIAVMRQIKAVLDPDGILNPGKMLPLV